MLDSLPSAFWCILANKNSISVSEYLKLTLIDAQSIQFTYLLLPPSITIAVSSNVSLSKITNVTLL